MYKPIQNQNQSQMSMAIDQSALNAAITQFDFLSPDALMSYCASRMRGIDTQVQGAFAKQNRDNADSKVLSDFSSSITLPTEDSLDLSNNDTVKSVGQGAQDYINEMAKRFDDAAGQVSDPQTAAALRQQAGLLRDDVAHKRTVNQAGLKAAITDCVSKIQQNLNSGAELSMINLQSLMSQRQQAIQVCTNLVQALGDQANKIADNVGK